MELNKAKEIYGALLEQANKARTQLIMENGDALAYQQPLTEEAEDEFKAISVITSVAFRELVKAGIEPEPVKNKPGFVQIDVNGTIYMSLASITQGTLEQSITKAALKEEADKIGLSNTNSQNTNQITPITSTTINNNGINI